MNENTDNVRYLTMVKSAARLQPRIDEPSPKRESFKRLAESRLNKAIAAIEILENLITPSYESSKEARDFIVEQLQMAVDSVEQVYKTGKSGRKSIEIPD